MQPFGVPFWETEGASVCTGVCSGGLKSGCGAWYSVGPWRVMGCFSMWNTQSCRGVYTRASKVLEWSCLEGDSRKYRWPRIRSDTGLYHTGVEPLWGGVRRGMSEISLRMSNPLSLCKRPKICQPSSNSTSQTSSIQTAHGKLYQLKKGSGLIGPSTLGSCTCPRADSWLGCRWLLLTNQ